MKRLLCAITLFVLTSTELFASVPTSVQFTAVSSNTASVSWSLDTPGTETPLVVISTDASFAVAASSGTLALGTQSWTFASLLSNATYYLKVKVSTETTYGVPVSSITPPDLPQGAGFTDVYFTSAAVSWSKGNNAGGSSYYAEVAPDQGFTMNTAFSSGTALTAAFGALIPNTTYFLRAKTIGAGGEDSAFSDLGSTVTLAYPPSGEVYALVTSTGMSVFWDYAGNPDGTLYELVVATAAGFSTVNYSTITGGNFYEAAGLQPNTTYYFKAAAVNGSGVRSAFTVFAPTATFAAAPLPDPPGLGAPTATSVTARWLINGNPVYTEYYVQASTASNYTGLDYGPGAWFAAASRDINTLDSGRPYYFRVRARDLYGRPSAWLQLGSTTTLPGADTTPPSVIDLQGGDDAWRGEASGFYMVHFSDLDSKLAKFQVKITTGPAFTGTVTAGWLDAVTSISSETYTTDWPLPPAAFNAIQENVTGYVSVRVYDNAGNVTISTDVFYVKRDTTPPNIINNAVSPQTWLAADPGAVFDVDFNDALSGLSRVLYSASDQPGTGNADLLGWTDLAGFVPGTSYTAPLAVDFSRLADGASNYISLRAVDAAGNARTLNDAFRIMKNSVGPVSAILSPGGAYVSTVAAITGAAFPRNETSPVAFNQVSLQELTGSLYYDGASFASSTEVWFGAQGLASWSYNASTVPFAAGIQYRVRARSRDVNGLLTRVPYPAAVFQLDQAAPSVYLSKPAPSALVYAFDEVSGTAADTGGSGLLAVDVFVKRLADSRWWNFSTGAWGDVPVSSAVPGGAAWNFAPDTLLRGSLAHGQQYWVQAVAKDSALPANASAFGAAGSTFTWMDTIPPETISQLTASSGTSPGRINLAWVFAGDDGGAFPLTYGQFAVQYSTYPGAVFSTGAAQVLISTGLVLPGATQYNTVAGLVPEATYYLKVWVKDDADLWSGASPAVMSISGKNLDNMISGTVKLPSGRGITGVQVEAISSAGLVTAVAYTLDDGNGSFTLAGLPDGFYRVQAAWVQDSFSSSIAKDQIPMGYADANFVLSVQYLLASVSGVLPLSRGGGLVPSSAGGGKPQLWQGGQLVASAQPDAAGRFSIRGLIPGAYTLRVAQENGEWKSLPIQLTSGQNLEVKPLGQLLRKNSVYAYPNPAKTGHITFHLETDIAPVRKSLFIYSIDGTLVKSAENGDAGWAAGGSSYEYRWNFSGGKPASGIYFYSVKLKNELSGETGGETRKFAVIR